MPRERLAASVFLSKRLRAGPAAHGPSPAQCYDGVLAMASNADRMRRRQEKKMDAVAEDAHLPADIDAEPLVQAAIALRPEVRRYHEQIEREQRLAPPLVEQLRAAGFYRMVIPRSLGGLQVDPLTYLRVVEVLAEGAGSVGWNVCNNSIGQLVTLGLPDDGVDEIYPRGNATVMAGTAVPGRGQGGAGGGGCRAARRRD